MSNSNTLPSDENTALEKRQSKGMTRRGFLYFAGVSAAIAAFSNPLSAFATDLVSASSNEDIPEGEIKDGIFYYPGTGTVHGEGDYEGELRNTFYFNQSFFETSAMEYDPHMATFACCLALSSFSANYGGKSDYSHKYHNAEWFFTQLKCESGVIVPNDGFQKRPEQDTIGLICAHRPILVNKERYNLVMLGIRGAGYELEWCSNLKPGKEGNHQGFSEAASKAVEFLKGYIKGQGLTGKTKVLIAGFSRAAATTNMTAGAIINEAISSGASVEKEEDGYVLDSLFENKINISQKDLYAYCFEAPAGVYAPTDADKQTMKTRYKNIHSIINPCDLVPFVMPTEWNFVRYGNDLKLPAPTDASKFSLAQSRMARQLKKLSESVDYTVIDRFPSINYPTAWIKLVTLFSKHMHSMPPLNLYLSDFFKAVEKDLVGSGGRGNFYNEFQEPLRTLYALYFDFDEKVTGEVRKMFNDKSGNLFTGGLDKVEFALDVFTKSNDYLYYDVCIRLLKAFQDTDKEKKTKLRETWYAKFRDALKPVLTEKLCSFIKENVLLLCAFALKSSDVFVVHTPGLCLAWLQAMDSNYVKFPIVYKDESKVALLTSAQIATASNTTTSASSTNGASAGTSAGAGASANTSGANSAASANNSSDNANASTNGNAEDSSSTGSSSASGDSVNGGSDTSANTDSAQSGSGSNNANSTSANANTDASNTTGEGVSNSAGQANNANNSATLTASATSATLLASEESSDDAGIDYDDDDDSSEILEYDSAYSSRYRKVRFKGEDLTVYALVNGQKYVIFENDCKVEHEDTTLPFSYGVNFDLQMCVWLDASTEFTFEATTSKLNSPVRCVVSRLDNDQVDPIAVYAYESIPEAFGGLSDYSFTVAEDSFSFCGQSPDGNAFESGTCRGEGYQEGDDPDDKTNSRSNVTDNDTLFYTISSKTEPEEAGGVFGGGLSLRGSHSLLFPMESSEGNYEFDYWSIDGARVSNDDPDVEVITGDSGDVVHTYKVLVDADHEVVAHYKQASGENDTNGNTNQSNTDAESSANTEGGNASNSTAKTGDNLGVAGAFAVGAATIAGGVALANGALDTLQEDTGAE